VEVVWGVDCQYYRMEMEMDIKITKNLLEWANRYERRQRIFMLINIYGLACKIIEEGGWKLPYCGLEDERPMSYPVTIKLSIKYYEKTYELNCLTIECKWTL